MNITGNIRNLSMISNFITARLFLTSKLAKKKANPITKIRKKKPCIQTKLGGNSAPNVGRAKGRKKMVSNVNTTPIPQFHTAATKNNIL